MPTPDITIYVVLCDHGPKIGQCFAERDPSDTDLETTIADIAAGQIESVIAVYAFNPCEGWSTDATDDVLHAVAMRKARVA